MTDAEEAIPTPPEGFEAFQRRGPFSTHNGPYFHKPRDEGAEQAFYVLKRHCNGMNLLHGGMVSAFLDGLLANAVYRATGAASVTIHLSLDFLSMARAGDWVVGEAKVTRATRDVVFVEGGAMVGSRQIARASAIFKLVRHKPD